MSADAPTASTATEHADSDDAADDTPDANASVRRAVATYTLYKVFHAAGFATPFYVVYMVGRGVTYTDLALGGAVMAVVQLAGEVPSGYVADRLGRKRTVLVAQALATLGVLGYLLVTTTVGVVAMYLAFGLAAAARSGVDTAWLYDTLDAYDASDEYAAITSRMGAITQGSAALTQLAGAALFLLAPWTAIAAGVLVNVLCVPVIAAFPGTAGESPDGETVGVREAAAAARDFVANSAVRTVIVLAALVYAAVYANTKYVQPTVLASLPDATVVPPPVVLAVTYAAFSLASAVTVRFGDRAADRLGVGLTLLIAYGASAACMLVPAVLPALTVPAVVGFMALPALAGPARSAYLNEHTASMARATTLSAFSFVRSVVRLPVLLISGPLADAYSPTLAMAAAGAFALCGGALVVFADRPLTVDE